MTTDYTDNTDMEGLIHEKISEEIIGAAMAVLNELKPGLDEKLYENALEKSSPMISMIPAFMAELSAIIGVIRVIRGKNSGEKR